MTRTVTAAFAIAVIVVPTAISAGHVGPSLTVVQRSPLQVRGRHFRPHEQVVVKATTRVEHATATVRTGRLGRFLVGFGHFADRTCLPLTIIARGSSGDRAKLVVAPPNPSETPCPI